MSIDPSRHYAAIFTCTHPSLQSRMATLMTAASKDPACLVATQTVLRDLLRAGIPVVAVAVEIDRLCMYEMEMSEAGSVAARNYALPWSLNQKHLIQGMRAVFPEDVRREFVS